MGGIRRGLEQGLGTTAACWRLAACCGAVQRPAPSSLRCVPWRMVNFHASLSRAAVYSYRTHSGSMVDLPTDARTFTYSGNGGARADSLWSGMYGGNPNSVRKDPPMHHGGDVRCVLKLMLLPCHTSGVHCH